VGDFTLFPPPWRAATSCEVNLAIDTDFTRCVNSRLHMEWQVSTSNLISLTLTEPSPQNYPQHDASQQILRNTQEQPTESKQLQRNWIAMYSKAYSYSLYSTTGGANKCPEVCANILRSLLNGKIYISTFVREKMPVFPKRKNCNGYTLQILWHYYSNHHENIFISMLSQIGRIKQFTFLYLLQSYNLVLMSKHLTWDE